jgi:hypothetical protein
MELQLSEDTISQEVCNLPTLTYLVWAVPRHPEVQTKLQAELKPCSADPLGKGL